MVALMYTVSNDTLPTCDVSCTADGAGSAELGPAVLLLGRLASDACKTPVDIVAADMSSVAGCASSSLGENATVSSGNMRL